MNTKNQAITNDAVHYPLGDALPEPGSTIEVAPGIYWLRMRLSMHPYFVKTLVC